MTSRRTKAPALKVDELHFSFDHSAMFAGASFEIGVDVEEGRGHVAALIGSSGRGKTTLLRLLSGLLDKKKGSISFQPDKPRISYLPQIPVIFEHLSIQENVHLFRRMSAHRQSFNESLLTSCIDILNMRSILDQKIPPANLSGGEKQRICLARAISIDPHVLLLDEPCTGLDISVKQDFLFRLRKIVDDNALLVIYATHHGDEARVIADSVIYAWKPDKEGPVDLICKSFQDFVDEPPTMEAAHFLAPEPLNIIRGCRVRAGAITLPDSTIVGTVSGVNDSACSIAFHPSIMSRDDETRMNGKSAFLEVCVNFTSNQYSFASIRNSTDILILPFVATRHRPERVRLTGAIMVFLDSGKAVRGATEVAS